jgi:hypothetical protein
MGNSLFLAKEREQTMASPFYGWLYRDFFFKKTLTAPYKEGLCKKGAIGICFWADTGKKEKTGGQTDDKR